MKFLPFDPDRHAVEILQRVKRLERAANESTRPQTIEIATFSVVGDMEVRTSGKYMVVIGGQVVQVKTSVTGAGTANTEFDILLNGTALGSGVVVDDAEADGQSDYLGDYRAPAGSTLQLDITAAGMHEGMVVQVVMKG